MIAAMSPQTTTTAAAAAVAAQLWSASAVLKLISTALASKELACLKKYVEHGEVSTLGADPLAKDSSGQTLLIWHALRVSR